MPEICRFYGIVIKMYFADHAPPHFHAEYSEHEATNRHQQSGSVVWQVTASPGLTPSENDTSGYWRVKDADRFYQEFAALNLPSEGIPRLTAPVDQPWGMREFTLVDPSGNLVRVGHDLGDAYIPQDS